MNNRWTVPGSNPGAVPVFIFRDVAEQCGGHATGAVYPPASPSVGRPGRHHPCVAWSLGTGVSSKRSQAIDPSSQKEIQ